MSYWWFIWTSSKKLQTHTVNIFPIMQQDIAAPQKVVNMVPPPFTGLRPVFSLHSGGWKHASHSSHRQLQKQQWVLRPYICHTMTLSQHEVWAGKLPAPQQHQGTSGGVLFTEKCIFIKIHQTAQDVQASCLPAEPTPESYLWLVSITSNIWSPPVGLEALTIKHEQGSKKCDLIFIKLNHSLKLCNPCYENLDYLQENLVLTFELFFFK